MARSRDWEAFASAGSKTEPRFTLTDEQWSLIADLLPEPEASSEGGRPPAPSRACFEGICWVLQTGARWKDLPRSFPSGSTCWRRLRDWTNSGAWERAWSRLLRRLDCEGALDTSEGMADGTFCSAKKGALGGQDQARQRHQDHGAYRCRRSAVGCAHHERQSTRSDLDRAIARAASAPPLAGASLVRLGR